MRYGYDSGCIVGITPKPDTVARWTLSLHICSQLRKDLARTKDGHKDNTVMGTAHKEESHAKIASDGTDREKDSNNLNNYTDPVDSYPPRMWSQVSLCQVT